MQKAGGCFCARLGLAAALFGAVALCLPRPLHNLNAAPRSLTHFLLCLWYSGTGKEREDLAMQIVIAVIGVIAVLILVYLGYILMKGE